MRDTFQVIEETYGDLNMSEFMDWDTYEDQVAADLANNEAMYLEEDEYDVDYLEDWEDEDDED